MVSPSSGEDDLIRERLSRESIPEPFIRLGISQLTTLKEDSEAKELFSVDSNCHCRAIRTTFLFLFF
jgi:hypothetical protein